MSRQATCHCRALMLRCAGEPAKISLCHCFDCQRRTGSLFSVAAFFPRNAVQVVTGAANIFRRPSASGFDVTFHFCRDCGSSLWWEPQRMPALVGVAAGSFADRDFPVPEQAVWGEEGHRWLVMPDGLVTHARNPIKAGNPGQG